MIHPRKLFCQPQVLLGPLINESHDLLKSVFPKNNVKYFMLSLPFNQDLVER